MFISSFTKPLRFIFDKWTIRIKIFSDYIPYSMSTLHSRAKRGGFCFCDMCEYLVKVFEITQDCCTYIQYIQPSIPPPFPIHT